MSSKYPYLIFWFILIFFSLFGMYKSLLSNVLTIFIGLSIVTFDPKWFFLSFSWELYFLNSKDLVWIFQQGGLNVNALTCISCFISYAMFCTVPVPALWAGLEATTNLIYSSLTADWNTVDTSHLYQICITCCLIINRFKKMKLVLVLKRECVILASACM